jgi:hypothetical protein
LLIFKAEAIKSSISNFQLPTYGVVAKWEGKGLQNPDHGFKSRRRLKSVHGLGGPDGSLFRFYSQALRKHNLDQVSSQSVRSSPWLNY